MDEINLMPFEDPHYNFFLDAKAKVWDNSFVLYLHHCMLSENNILVEDLTAIFIRAPLYL